MIDHITDIPFPGRSFTSPRVNSEGQTTTAIMPSFVAGPENRLVAAAVGEYLRCIVPRGAAEAAGSRQHVVVSPSSVAPTVLALYGPSGTGKTHLAQGIVRYWESQRGVDSAQYLTATDFRRQLSAAWDAETLVEFRRQVRGRELLAIDDLHRLPNDGYIQQELRQTIEAYEANGTALVVTSTRPVSALGNLSPDLHSRLSSGLVLRLAPPGTAARQRLARQLAAAVGYQLSDDDAHRLAGSVAGTTNDLCGAVLGLIAQRPPRCGSNERWTQEFLAARAARLPAMRQIISAVAKHFGVPQKVLKSGSRRQSVVFARAVAVYLARELSSMSYERIGRCLGGRDHTTIMHSYRKINDEAQRHPPTRQTVEDLCRILSVPY